MQDITSCCSITEHIPNHLPFPAMATVDVWLDFPVFPIAATLPPFLLWILSHTSEVPFGDMESRGTLYYLRRKLLIEGQTFLTYAKVIPEMQTLNYNYNAQVAKREWLVYKLLFLSSHFCLQGPHFKVH